MLMKSRLRTKEEKRENYKLRLSSIAAGIVLVIVINILAQAFESTAVYFSALIGLLAMALGYLEYLVELKIREQSEKEKEN
ncbi:MAG: hypothetical protein HY314_13310 [Acidobacteria bacterium]|nr:hypothetical protein [Acidobacteriota bacterium]